MYEAGDKNGEQNSMQQPKPCYLTLPIHNAFWSWKKFKNW